MPDETKDRDRDFQGVYEQAQALAFSRRPRQVPIPVRDSDLPEPGLLEKAGAMSPASWRSQEDIEAMEAMDPEEADKRAEARAKLDEMDRQERIQRRETELKPWREWDVMQDGLLGRAAQSPRLAGFEGFMVEGTKSAALGAGTVASSAASMTVSALQTATKILTLGQASKLYEFSDNALGWIHELNDTARAEYFSHIRESSYAGGPVGEWGVAAAEIAGNIGVLAGEMAFRLKAMKIVTGHLYGQSGAVVSEQAEKAARTFESLRNMPGMSKVAGEAAKQANMVRSLSQAKTWADGVLQGTVGNQAAQRALGAIKMGVMSSLMRRYDTEGGEFMVDYLSNAGWATAFMATTVASGMIGGEGAGSIIRIGADFGLNSVLSMARGEFGDSFEQGYQEAKAAGLSEEQAVMRGNMQLGIVHLVNAVFASKTTSYASERAKAQYVAGRLPELQATAGRVENFKKEMVQAQRVGVLFEIDRRIHSSERAGRADDDPTLQRLREERARWANAADDEVSAHSMVWMRDNLEFDLSKQSETYLQDLERNVTSALESNRGIREDRQKTAENQRRTQDLRGDPPATAAKIGRALAVAGWDNVSAKLGDSLDVHVKGIRERVQQALNVRASSLEGKERTALNRRAGAVGRMGAAKLLATAQELFPKADDFARQFGSQGRAIISGVVKAVDDGKQEADQKQLFPEDELQGLKAYASWVREAQPDIARTMAEQSAVEREATERVAAVETEVRQAADERKAERDEVERISTEATKRGARSLGQRLPGGSVIRDADGVQWTVEKGPTGAGRLVSQDGTAITIGGVKGRTVLEGASVVSRPGPDIPETPSTQSLADVSRQLGIRSETVEAMPPWLQERLVQLPELHQQISVEFLAGARAGRAESDVAREIADRGPDSLPAVERPAVVAAAAPAPEARVSAPEARVVPPEERVAEPDARLAPAPEAPAVAPDARPAADARPEAVPTIYGDLSAKEAAKLDRQEYQNWEYQAGNAPEGLARTAEAREIRDPTDVLGVRMVLTRAQENLRQPKTPQELIKEAGERGETMSEAEANQRARDIDAHNEKWEASIERIESAIDRMAPAADVRAQPSLSADQPITRESVAPAVEDIGPRPVDSFGADLTAKLHEHVARALGKTFSGDAQEAPKDNAERAWDLLRHEATRLPKDVREALDQLAPTKADAERLYEFREYAASNNREISNRQAEERATVFARQGTAAIEREMLRLGDNIQAVDAESRAVADAETNRIFAGLSEDEVTGLFRHLWGRQVNTEDGDPSRLSPAQREAVADMDRLMAVELDRVNYARQQEGLDPIQQLPNYFPLLRPGQFASTAEVFQAGRSMSQMFAVFNSPESIHNRDDGVKDIGVYAQDAKAQFHHYLRTMRAYSAMRTDYDGDGSRATDIYNAIHNMSRRAYTPDVIMAREAWAKAQDEGAKEPRTDLERVGADFERNLDAMRDTLAKRDMIDDVSQIPSREENRLISAASQAVNEGRMFAIRKIEAMIVHPMALVSKIDGTRTFETGELGPNERLWKRGGIDAPAFAMRLIEQMGQGLRKIMQDNGYGEHTWIRGDAKLTRINHWQERHIDDFEKMSDADVARVVEASDMPDMPIAKRLPMMFARTISESDVKAYRAILGETQRLYREAEPHFTKMYAIRHKAFKDAHFRDMGDSQSFFAKVEALVSRIAVAESQADNINAAMKLSRFYRSSGFGTEQQRAVLSDFWRDTALVSWARGPHEWDKSWFSRGLQDDKRDQQESLRSRDWLDKGRDLLNRKGVFEQVVRTTNAYLPRLFLAGNPRWSFTKQWTSVVGGAGTVGLQNLAQGMAVNAYNSLMETLASRGLVDQPAKTEGGWHGSPLREIKQRRSMAVSVNEQDQQSLRRSVRKISTSFANSLSRVMEDGLTGSMMEGALIRGRNLGMTGDRLQFFATKAAGTSQSIYNRDSRQVLLNSQIFRFFAPFQSFAFDAYTNMIWEPTRAGGMAGRERLGYVLQGMMAVAMVNYLSEWMFGRKAFQSVDPDTPSWQPWMSYGSFIPIIGAGRGPRGNYEIPAYNAVASPIYRSLQRYFETGDLVRLGKDTSPFFVAAMGLPSAQMVPQVVDTFDAMRYDGMAFTKRGVPFKALEDDSLFEYYTDIVMGLAFGPERSPTARRRIEQDRETQQQ